MAYETVIGLEVHVELLTSTKLFCGCPNRFGASPNSQVCPVCLGLPGVMPVMNRRAVELLVKAALALGCAVQSFSRFDRKNYFYPDMPKNYQISQYDLPLAVSGFLEIPSGNGARRVAIRRIHLEEDTGKSIHQGAIDQSEYTLEDYNRAGVPLLEIVSEPDLFSPAEAYDYLVALRDILSWLEVSDCRMEEGSLRCDANISLRTVGAAALGTKVEVKNMNSFRSVRSALQFEEERQRELLEKGEAIPQETRGWDEGKLVTISMRSKEETHDYRYFPEPDLVPVKLDDATLERFRRELPEMPGERRRRFVSQYGLPGYDAGVLTATRDFADFFEETVQRFAHAKTVSNWMMGEVSRLTNATDVALGSSKLTPTALARTLSLVEDGIISGAIAKSLLEEIFRSGGDPDTIVREKRWLQISDDGALRPVIAETLDAHGDCVSGWFEGKEKVLGFLVGQVMRRMAGKANPGAINKLLREELEKRRPPS